MLKQMHSNVSGLSQDKLILHSCEVLLEMAWTVGKVVGWTKRGGDELCNQIAWVQIPAHHRLIL